MQGRDCTSVNAAIFVRSHILGQTSRVRFISQKQGLPTNTSYLAVNNTTGSLFLTNGLNTYNVFDQFWIMYTTQLHRPITAHWMCYKKRELYHREETSSTLERLRKSIIEHAW